MSWVDKFSTISTWTPSATSALIEIFMAWDYGPPLTDHFVSLRSWQTTATSTKSKTSLGFLVPTFQPDSVTVVKAIGKWRYVDPNKPHTDRGMPLHGKLKRY